MKTLSDLMRRTTRNAAAELHVALPARVLAYDFSRQMASVQPTLRRSYSDGREDDMPILSSVPVVFPRAGGASLTMPVRAGDTVLLVFSERSLDEWLARGGTVTPEDRRLHALVDAVAIPGLVPFVTGSLAENNDDVLLTYDGSKVRLKPGGVVEVESGGTMNFKAGGKMTLTAPHVEVVADRFDMP